MSLESEIRELGKELVASLTVAEMTITTAESCTGGLVAKAITDIPGASKIYDRGFITYSNNSKIDHLGVNGSTLEQHGAVSEQTAKEMAQGAKRSGRTNFALSTTGIAGPNSDNTEKPVGLVYIGITDGMITKANKYIFKGDRNAVRLQATKQALTDILELLQ